MYYQLPSINTGAVLYLLEEIYELYKDGYLSVILFVCVCVSVCGNHLLEHVR